MRHSVDPLVPFAAYVLGSGHRSDPRVHGESTEEEPLRLDVEVEVLQTSCLSDHAFPKASTSQCFTAGTSARDAAFSPIQSTEADTIVLTPNKL
jgi:hypothetical protein